MQTTKRILAIHAHPDDVEFLAAGTLHLLKQAGHEIILATMTAGDKGSPNLTSAEIAAIRRDEAARSAALLGAPYHCLEFPDGAVFDDDASRRRVCELIRQCRPDVILTASPQDYMADHEAASALVRNASFLAGVRLYDTGTAEPLAHMPHLYYMDPIEGKDMFGVSMQPQFVVDISQDGAADMKATMLMCHASQREWLKAHHGVDHYIDSMREWTRVRGEQFGLPAAEGFRQHLGHAYPQDNILQQLLDDKVHRANTK